jgi:predicted RNA binding protein YcfA (HicA-like mRNA interferase family)
VPKVRDARRLIEEAGWRLVRTRGSHRHFRHPSRPGTVTIPGRDGDELATGTWASIMKQAGIKKADDR